MKKFQQTREIIEYTQKYISGKTLDLGAGSAKYRDMIKPKTSEYLAFDMVPGKNIDIVGNVLDLPFLDNTFDTVISTQVLEHVEKPWVMVKEIYRVLKPGGICILTTPFLTPYHPDPADFFRYTLQGVKSLFQNEGFKILECDYYGQAFTLFSEMIRFVFFNRYQKKNGVWAERFLRYMQKTAKFFDKFVKTDIIYVDNYLIARK